MGVLLLQRYFADEVNANGQLVISGDDYHHVVRVMRMDVGDKLICVDGSGKSCICTIAEITDKKINCNVVECKDGSSELPIRVSIASGLPKGDKLEWIIQKGTELGADQFVPFTAARSIVKWDEKKADKKVERWQKIAKEAAEQSHRNKVPTVHFPINLNALIEASKNYDCKLIAYEEDSRIGEASVLAKSLKNLEENNTLFVVFGPEGGLDQKEVEKLQEHGFQTCGLGPRILRTETAPLALLSAVSYHFELSR
ncbi:Ribosomal RNA small subunit methyltransferase E [Pseudoneobacillus rhizosphaerae]|uniref:Ribosomal RNA small subunit methyltransferase E n=1 Tax=Pseudoneobacillus rhizosphaerae TaxID=2880968 RepID=A0A9C7G9K6_9BACI|nr:Ribosomal RNA small subunit methyltransferase E [Pseudoneobacillus rhizosphaerae]